MVETYVIGFKDLHGNGDHDNVTFVNYRDVGFGLIMDTRLVHYCVSRFGESQS